MIVLFLGVAVLSLTILHLLLRYNSARKLSFKVPGPTPLPFFGNLLMFNVSLDKFWDKTLQLLDEFYPLVRVWGFKANYVFVRHPDDMKVLLNKQNISKTHTVYDSFRSINNDGLVISDGEKWRQRRKLLNPAFNPDLLRVYTDIANEHAEKFIENIKKHNEQVIPDIASVFLQLGLEIICEATMGVDPNMFGFEKAEKFRQGFDELSSIAYYRASRPYLQDWMMKFLSVGRKQELAAKTIRDFAKKIIQDRREYHKKIDYKKFQNGTHDLADGTTFRDSINKRKRLAVLDLLLAAEMDNLIDQNGINEEVETIIVAGYETSGMAIALALMQLAENKSVQDLARQEVTEILNQTKGVLTVADINKFDYLDRCIKETLRLYPSAPIVGRSIKNKITLSDYEIPHGTEAILNFFALHRDPNFWLNPEKFDPDRFLPENTKERHPFAY